ncbi:MAG TPA: hypothetical protein VN512_13205 [Clostridia bacterium]|nr:hypothetical protein [Clostridia bacterium]
MSIVSELDRLQTAKADIATQITAKGVTVPGGTKMDEFAPLIADIETGVNFPSMPSAGDTPLFAALATKTVSSINWTNLFATFTIKNAGTYRFKYAVQNSSANLFTYAHLAKNGTEVTNSLVTISAGNTGVVVKIIDVACALNDIMNFQMRAVNSGSGYSHGLVVSILADDVQAGINDVMTIAII